MRALPSLCAALLAGMVLAAPAVGDDGPGDALVNPGHLDKPDWFKVSFLDLPADVEEAAAADRRLLLYFYQDGCPYCARLETVNWRQREIVEKTQAQFEVLAINLWGDREVTALDGTATTEKRFAAAMRVMFTPTLVFLDEEGRVVLRVNGYYPPHRFAAALDYVGGRHEGEQDFSEFYAARAPAPASGRLHLAPWHLQPPYDLTPDAREGERPLVVLFEQPECRACDELHGEALRRPEVDGLLRRFDVALLNSWSQAPVVTPAGERLPVREWALRLGVQYTPSMVFFDAAGREVFRSEAYLRPFHVGSVLEYVASGAYREQPSFQRFVQDRAERLREQGQRLELWE